MEEKRPLINSELEPVEILKENEDKLQRAYEDRDNKGVLFLRFFKKDPSNGKILTLLNRKVYFPKEKIGEGWYVACVIEERDNHGVMDTIPLKDIRPDLWNPKYIKGIYLSPDYENSILKIYPAVPKERLNEVLPNCIHTIPLPKRDDVADLSINDLISSKEEEIDKDK